MCSLEIHLLLIRPRVWYQYKVLRPRTCVASDGGRDHSQITLLPRQQVRQAEAGDAGGGVGVRLCRARGAHTDRTGRRARWACSVAARRGRRGTATSSGGARSRAHRRRRRDGVRPPLAQAQTPRGCRDQYGALRAATPAEGSSKARVEDGSRRQCGRVRAELHVGRLIGGGGGARLHVQVSVVIVVALRVGRRL